MGWLGIIRLGLVQTALGAIVVLTTSTINRLMIVELALPAVIPGALVTLHYALQVLRPRWGHGADVNRSVTPWIIGGMAILAGGGVLAALSIAVLQTQFAAGMAVAILGFVLIGIGVGASGTSLLTLLAKSVPSSRRAAAATVVWVMMILGFIATSATLQNTLDPFTPLRLIQITSIICAVAFLLTCLAVFGIEKNLRVEASASNAAKPDFSLALKQVWRDSTARQFTIFIFVSMLAYSAQDLILEPFAGLAFAYTPGQTSELSKLQNMGVLAGMVLVGVLATKWSGRRGHALKLWTVAGCIGSAVALAGLFAASRFAPAWPLKETVVMLGFCNGVFAVAAIGSMFSMASAGEAREGVRMGVFGAAQAVAFGMGGFAGTALADILRYTTGAAATGYGAVFAIEAVLFVMAAMIAWRLSAPAPASSQNPLVMAGAHHAGL
jgi:MFS transporter, BCD family, chlorophyll transporter